METRRLGSRTASGLSSTAFTMVKIVVLAPTPRPSETTAAAVNRGFFTRRRAAYRRSSRQPPRAPAGAGVKLASGAGRGGGVPRAAWISAEKASAASSRLISASAAAGVCPSRTARARRSSSSRASSSTRSASWCGSSRSGASRSRTARLQSRIGRPHHAVHRGHEGAPGVLLVFQHLPAGRGEAVVAAAALARPLHPASGHPAAPLQAVEQRVEGGHVELYHAVAAQLDLLADVVA